MKTMKLILGIFTLLIFSLPTFASNNQGALEWQRFKLEKELEKGLRESLTPVLTENQYVISVQVLLTQDDDGAAVRGPASETVATSDLPLSKLGFWGPLLDETNGGEISESAIFGRIAQVDVKMILDERVPESKKILVEEVINRGVASVSRTVPVINISQGDLVSSSVAVARSWSDWVLEFKNGISVIFASVLAILLLSIFGWMVAKDFSSIFRKGVESVDSYISFQKENGARKPEDNFSSDNFGSIEEEPVAGRPATVVQSMPSPGFMAAPSMDVHDATKDGFEKFRELHQKAPELAKSLVKKWINSRSANDAKALMVLGKRSDVEEMNEIFGALSDELKQACKRLLALPFGPNAETEGLEYIGRQVIEQYVSSRPSLPESTLALIESLTEKEFLEIAQSSVEMGAILLSALPTGKVSVLLNSMSTDLFQAVSSKTAGIYDKDISGEAQAIEELIKGTRERQVKRSAFLEKSMELIPSASPEKENILYKMLIQSGDLDLVRDTALKSLPSSLVTQIPGEVVQRILTRMGAMDRAELICSQPEDRAEFLLSCLGAPGDKLRDLVETELDDVKADALRVEALREDADSLWSALVGTLRALQRQNPTFARSLKPLVNRWVKELSENAGNGVMNDAA